MEALVQWSAVARSRAAKKPETVREGAMFRGSVLPLAIAVRAEARLRLAQA